MTFLVAPIEAVSSQRSEEIEPKAGIAIANTKVHFAPNYSIGIQFYLWGFYKNKKPFYFRKMVFLKRAGGGTRTHDLLITNQLL